MTQTQKQNMPKLRFPGFDAPLDSVKLGDVAIFSKGKGISKNDIDPDGNQPCIRYGELYTVYDTIIDQPISKTTIHASNLKLSKGDEVLVPASGEDAKDIATAVVVKRAGVALGGDLNIIQSKNDGAFLASYLSGKRRMTLAAMAQGNSVVHLYPAQLRLLNLNLPTLPEQRKIAGFLSAVDTKIAQLAEKKRLLENYKKGCMQQLFSQKIRFKDEDGNDFPDWEKKKLGEVANIVGGGTPDSGQDEYWGGEIYWFTPTEMKSKYVTDSVRTISASGLKKSSAKLLPIGTILVTTRATVGDLSIAMKECCTNQGFQSLIVKDKNCNEFWYYWMVANKKELLRRASGSTFLEINKSEIAKIPTQRPHPAEQRKIADFLSALDRKIVLVAEEHRQAQTFKKGLLQQMFV